MEYDKKVEKSKDSEFLEFDLKGESARTAKTFTHTGTRKTTAYKFTQRERKPNATKGGIISEITSFLKDGSSFSIENINITNKERQIAFTIGKDNFELTLVQKRKPK